MIKHTPGPWIFAQHNKPGNGWVISAGWRTITRVDENTIGNIKEAKANARLIAAAPELLEALKVLVFLHSAEQEGLSEGMPTPEQWYKAVDAASEAITKAAGEGWAHA